MISENSNCTHETHNIEYLYEQTRNLEISSSDCTKNMQKSIPKLLAYAILIIGCVIWFMYFR